MEVKAMRRLWRVLAVCTWILPVGVCKLRVWWRRRQRRRRSVERYWDEWR